MAHHKAEAETRSELAACLSEAAEDLRVAECLAHADEIVNIRRALAGLANAAGLLLKLEGCPAHRAMLSERLAPLLGYVEITGGCPPKD
jgi:hypothetical protein